MDLVPVPLSASGIALLEAVSVANIDSPTELNSIVGSVVGERRVCYQAIANDNVYTVYYFDASDGSGASTPYVMAASGSGYWIAGGGKYTNSAVKLRSTLDVGGLASLNAGASVTGGFATMDVAGGTSRGLKWGATACQMVLYDDGAGTPYIDYQGSATNIPLNIRTKGTGIIRLLPGSGAIIGGTTSGALIGSETLRVVGSAYFDAGIAANGTSTITATASAGLVYTTSNVLAYTKLVSTAAHATTNQLGLDLYLNNASAVAKEYGYLVWQPNVGTAGSEQSKVQLGVLDAGAAFTALTFTGRDASFIRDVSAGGALSVTGTSTLATINASNTLTISGNAKFARVDHASSEGNLFVGYYNNTNSQGGLYVGSAGEPYFGSNIDHPSSADNYFRATIPAWRLGNTGGSTTFAVELDVAAAGSAGAAITWTTALKIDTTGNVTSASTTDASAIGTAAVVLSGGMSSAKKIIATGNIGTSGTLLAGALAVASGSASAYFKQTANNASTSGARFVHASSDPDYIQVGYDVNTALGAEANTLAFYSTQLSGYAFAVGRTGHCAAAGALKSISATAGIGYGTGAGGTVAQATSKATGVTLNTVCGTITMNGAALASVTSVAFTLTNSAIAATDLVVCHHDSVGTLGGYGIVVTPAAGTATITVRNMTAGSLSEAIVLRFAVIKAVTA